MRAPPNVYAVLNCVLFCITHTKLRFNSADNASIDQNNVVNYRYSTHIDIYSILVCGIANSSNSRHPRKLKMQTNSCQFI